MAFGDSIRYASAPWTAAMGIGGNSSVIWHSDPTEEVVAELNTSDLSLSRSAASPSTSGQGIGGDSSVIWHSDMSADRVYELLVSDFSNDRSRGSPGGQARGIGGDSSAIWHLDSTEDEVYELDISDLSVSRTRASPSHSPNGIGGDSSTIWHCTVLVPGRIYELKVSDLSVERQANLSIGSYPYGVGGDSTTIWNCGYATNRIYELDETAVVAPTVSTVAADGIGQTTANPRGNVTNTGGENPTRYIDYDIDSGAPYANSENCGVGGTGVYNSNLTGLIPGRKYYYRARAVNSEGTGTGSEMTFTTLSAVGGKTAHMAAKLVAEKMV